jgi:hypothetical protein
VTGLNLSRNIPKFCVTLKSIKNVAYSGFTMKSIKKYTSDLSKLILLLWSCRSLLFLGQMLYKFKKGNFASYQKWKKSISWTFKKGNNSYPNFVLQVLFYTLFTNLMLFYFKKYCSTYPTQINVLFNSF